MEDKEGIIKLVDEEEGIVLLEEYDGEEVRYEIVVVIDVEDDTYLILAKDEEDSEEGYALKVVKDEDGNKAYQPVLDEGELIKVQVELENLEE
ncbi:DUF1292 domain-containing protein [Halonatronum saccharophilum]|uniref:DUF1292 domain-containing protein n=1 Tax=Halonatronum saccharophilum TaxID=150060 RepID=UPI0004870B57|nr:DUF1292 domain-containing protein [Halonatronum saccharophilum]